MYQNFSMMINKKTIVALLFLFTTIFTFAQQKKTKDQHIPELNQQIIDYVSSVIGKQVDRGECWDLANQALTRANADWDRAFVYGREIDPTKDKVYPGDIIQFKNVKVEYREGNTTYKQEMKQHTAIVYKVLRKGVYELAHQNTGFSGRKVGLSKFDLSTVKKGKMWFYRPVKNLK